MQPTLTLNRRELKFSNLTKPLYPTGFTKGDLLDYYNEISATILPHLKDRPITFKRYPNGVNDKFFFEKNCPMHKPDWVATTPIARENTKGKFGSAPVNHCLINDAATLMWAANLAAIELHAPMAKVPHIDRPTAIVFDLDPGPPALFADCAKLALEIRDTLADLKLQSFPKSSGGKGLHLYIPLNNKTATFDQTKSFARTVADMFQKHHPDRVIASMSRADRAGKIFIDWSQNDRHKTTVAPYSLRAQQSPTVSAPLTWDEVEAAAKSRRKKFIPFLAAQLSARIGKIGDLFAPVLTICQKIPAIS